MTNNTDSYKVSFAYVQTASKLLKPQT